MANPQTSDVSNPQGIFATNAKWVNGIAPGYWPTAGAGLVLEISAGSAFSGTAIISYAGGTLTLANNATNYVYLDSTASYAPASNTTGFTSAGVPIATVVTAGGVITSITDNRLSPTVASSGGGGGSPGGSTHATQVNSGGTFGGVGPGTSGQVLTSNGASADPSFQNPASLVLPLVIGFVINYGAVLNDAAAMLVAPRAGTVSKCVIVTKASDPSIQLKFRIKQNGTDVFSTDPTVAAGTTSGTTSSSTSLTSVPLSVAAGDVFQIDILTGSPNWQFTAQLET